MQAASFRNLGILAHIDAGKTTVTERILFYTGVERRMGEVHDGTATMDWMEEERERGITITAAVTHCPWRDSVLQLIDTPGHVDFTAEVARALRVLDGVVIVLDAVAGPQAQTETVVRQASKHEVPMLLFVNKMDRPGANFEAAVAKAAERLHKGVIPVQLPFGQGRDLEGVLDLVEQRLLTWDKADLGVEFSVHKVPPAEQGRVAAARLELCSRVAALNDDWVDIFLDLDDLPNEILKQGLRQGTISRELVPALCGSALHNCGIQPLLDAVVDWLPSPLEVGSSMAIDPQTGRDLEVAPDPKAATSALVFKVAHEEHGDLAYLRIFSGTIRKGEALFNTRTGKREKLQALYAMHADHRDALDSCGPGSLLAVPGMSQVRTGDTLCTDNRRLLLASIEFPEPVLQQTLETNDAASRDRLGELLAILVREDPTLHFQEDEDTGGFLLSGMGELHLEVNLHRLQRQFKLDVRAGSPRVNYRETVGGECSAAGHLEIPGDTGMRVEVRVRLSPSEKMVPELMLAPGLDPLPQGLIDELQKAQMLQGWVGAEGFPLAQTRVLIESWSASSERPPGLDFFLGALQAAVAAAMGSGSVVLEPRMDLHVEVPDEHLSAVLADLQKRHSEILDITMEGDIQQVHARVPLSEMVAYSTALRSQTQGRGSFQMTADGFMPRS
ncbi:MAG: TetM/TetW/TetO/TetS family tetracycline resistance ribosomal protection protein [Planctomycetota bacterium]|jgi:elongation factor G|nr:TetM/TetW/TetO/TetS family tetracycline resistance ribosomal protection protein [Planctomycetota bacterium]